MKIRLKQGLSFNKEILSRLDENQLNQIKGGGRAQSTQGNACSCIRTSCHGTGCADKQ